MKCPHCNEEISFDAPILRNVECFGETQLGKTICCGKAVNVELVKSFRFSKYIGNKEEDNWGNKFKQ